LRELLLRLEKISGRRMPKHAVPASIAMVSAVVAEWIATWVTERPPVATREGVRLALRSARFDSRKAREELGFAPRPVEDALDQAVRWLSANTAP
jgi:dihydroflavonol-4-reductase